jgi:aldose 1-epimerase
MKNLLPVVLVGLAVLAPSAMVPILAQRGAATSASAYDARRTGDIVRLEDRKHEVAVSILTSAGNIAYEMTVKGQNILRFPFASVDEFKARPMGLHGIPLLAPWANRLDEPAFYANGKRYAFDMELGNVRGAIPMHGFVGGTDQWQVVEVRQDGKAAWVTSRLEVFRQPAWMKQWPFAHTIEMTYRLADGELEVRTAITNQSSEPMPVAIGYHPYFQLTDSPREEWTISVPARTRWLLSPQKVPTGETEPADTFFTNGTGSLKDYNLDDVFGDLVRDERGRATASVKGRSQKIDVATGPNFKALVIYSPNPANTGRGSQLPPPGQNPAPAPPRSATAPPREGTAPPRGGTPPQANPRATPNFICFEPMAGITDAINLAHKGIYKELQSVAPGATWRESFWVKPSGF